MVQVSYDNLPSSVQDLAKDGATADKQECCQCGTDLYYVDVFPQQNGYSTVYLTRGGRVPGGSAGWGGTPVEDQGALPRQLKPSEGTTLCGDCTDVTQFEQASAVHVVYPSGQHVAALRQGTVIDNHYITDESFDRTTAADAIEGVVLNQMPVEIDGVSLSPGGRREILTTESGDEVTVTVDHLKDGKNPTDVPLIGCGNTLFTPV